MKNIINKGAFHLMLALCAMGILTACSSDNALVGNEEMSNANAVKLNVTTRSGEGTEENPWLANDAIAVQYNINEENYINSSTYNFVDGAWTSSNSIFWPEYQTGYDFFGYYPTTATNNGTTFVIPTDQSDAAKLHAADYMTTECQYNVNNSKNGTTIDLNFSHRLVKVVMNITSAEYNGAVPTLSLVNIISQGVAVRVKANTTNETNSTVEKTGNVTNVMPFESTNAKGLPCYTALVSPGTITANSTLMNLVVNGEIRNVTVPSTSIDLESGKAYNFNVTIGRDKVEIGGVTVNNWTEVDVSNSFNDSPTFEQLLTEQYKKIREAMTTLTIDGPSIDETYLQDRLATFFPNVTTINILGTNLESKFLFAGCKNVTTIIGKDLINVPDFGFVGSSNKSFVLPNLQSVGDACFRYNSKVETLSLPKLTTINNSAFADMTNLKHVCFASLKDFANITSLFRKSDSITDLAFGTTEAMNMNSDQNMNYILNGPMNDGTAASKTTLYLNEDGEEYKNNVVGNTWRGITFKEIKNYSEYPYQKD